MDEWSLVEKERLAELEPLDKLSTGPVITEQLVHVDLRDERVQDVLERLRDAIGAVYPEAEFLAHIGTQPLGVYLEVYTERDIFGPILKILDEKFGNLNIAAGVDVCVVPRKKAQVQAEAA